MTSNESLVDEYEELFRKEEKIDEELQLLLTNFNYNQKKFNSIKSTIPKIQTIYGNANNLSNMINFTTNLADNVSSKVRVLDLAKSRVASCTKRVSDILDLKACTDGVTEALSEEDYETAANHIHRYLKLDKDSLRLKTTDSNLMKTNDNSSDVDINQYNAESYYLNHSFNLLQESKNKLQKIVEEKYDDALKTDDVPQLERFFKIFPLIGQSENGLSKFCDYLTLQITQAAEKNFETIINTPKTSNRWNIMFADALILLFEKVARVIEAYQPVIEIYYGKGHMILFTKNIQKECDLQASRILKKFRELRKLDEIFKTIQNCQKNDSLMISLPNHNSATETNNLEKVFERIDPRDLDELLTEITIISSRTELYKNFLMKSILSDLRGIEGNIQNDKLAEIDIFIKNCNLSFIIQELVGQYSILENYFMEENIKKAIQMDTLIIDSKTSSVVDDVFFIIKKCIKRCLYSDNVDGCCAMFNNCSTALDSIYKDYFYSQLKSGFSNQFIDLVQAYSAIQRRFQQTEQQTEKERLFLTTLNNVEESIEFINALKKIFEEDISNLFINESKLSRDKLNSCLSDLSSVTIRLKHLIEYGFSQLNNNDFKPRIKQWIENYNTLNHKITEEDFSQASEIDPFIQGLMKNIDNTVLFYKVKLSEKNQDTLIGILVSELVTSLEKSIYRCSFSKYGGIKLDKGLRVLINFLTNLTSYSIREKFARLTQISIILSLDTIKELSEYWNSPLTITWRLTPNEIRQILSLRYDFKSSDIKSLNL